MPKGLRANLQTSKENGILKKFKRIISSMDDWQLLSDMVAKRFEKSQKPFQAILQTVPKSNEQLGYLHSECLPVYTQMLFDIGEIEKLSEDAAKYYLKVQIGYGEWIRFRASVVFDPHSFAEATLEQLGLAIDKILAECALRNYHVAPPKEKIAK